MNKTIRGTDCTQITFMLFSPVLREQWDRCVKLGHDEMSVMVLIMGMDAFEENAHKLKTVADAFRNQQAENQQAEKGGVQ